MHSAVVYAEKAEQEKLYGSNNAQIMDLFLWRVMSISHVIRANNL